MLDAIQEIRYEIDGECVDGGREGETWFAIYSVPVDLDTGQFDGDESLAEEYDQNPRYARACTGEGCDNLATPGDWRVECLTCNPYGDSLVMNNDPEYTSWLFSNY